MSLHNVTPVSKEQNHNLSWKYSSFRIEQLKALLDESTTSESDSDESHEDFSHKEKRKRHRKSKAHKKEKKKT